MKTYAETRGKEPFDWNKFLDDRIAGVELSEDDQARASRLAYHWVTCACSLQCASIPRDERGGPYDSKLNKLGCRFMDEIEQSEWEDAKETLQWIEKRSAEILTEQAQ